MTNDFVPELPIDENLYKPDTKSMPWITWYGKHNDNNSQSGGRWGIKAEFLEGATPQPSSWWELVDKRYGLDPNEPSEQTWMVQRLRTAVIGVRRRFLEVEKVGNKEIEHPFLWATAKEKRIYPDGRPINGKLRYHYQVLTPGFAGIEMPIVISLKGYTKATCWSNVPKGTYGNADFPLGAEPALIQYTNNWNKEKKVKWPWLVSWLIDLVPVFSNNAPLWVDVGHGTYMNPFVLDMRVKSDVSDKHKDGYPESRFVGVDKFVEYQAMRQNIALDWEAQWASAENLAAAGDAAYDYEDTSENEVKEDDVIPF